MQLIKILTSSSSSRKLCKFFNGDADLIIIIICILKQHENKLLTTVIYITFTLMFIKEIRRRRKRHLGISVFLYKVSKYQRLQLWNRICFKLWGHEAGRRTRRKRIRREGRKKTLHFCQFRHQEPRVISDEFFISISNLKNIKKENGTLQTL